MIFFAIVAGNPLGVARVMPRMRPALARTRVMDGEWTECTAPSGQWAIVALSQPDPLCAYRLVTAGDSTVVCNGSAFTVGAAQPELAKVLSYSFMSGGSAEIVERITGAYNVVAIAPHIGLRAFGDWSGLYPLYWRQDGDVVVVSNRSLTVADLFGAHNWDEHALAWLISNVNLAGDAVPARGVRYIPPGYELRAEWGSGDVTMARSPNWIWPGPDEPGRDDLTPSEWDDVTHALIAQLQPLATIGEPLQLGLSGGKDSRLCLALATAAGLGDRLTTHTGGTQEVPFARAVAAAAGVAHRVGPPKPASTTNPSSPAPGDTWHRVRTNITRYDAIVCAWSALKNPIFAAVSIRGYGLPHGIQLSADASLLQSYGELDALGVVRREEAEAERAWLREWLSRNEHDVRADLLPEKFYVDFRLGHWSGPNIQGAPVHVDINPLLMQEAWRKCLQLSPAARRAERFHFEVMRRAAPELVTLPFYEDGWAPEIVASSSLALPVRPLPGQPRASRSSLRRSPLVRQVRAVLKRRSPPARAPQRRTATEAWSFLERDRDAIASLIDEAARETAFDTICDAKRLRRAVQSSEPFVRVGRARQVTNAVGVALTLLGRAEPVV